MNNLYRIFFSLVAVVLAGCTTVDFEEKPNNLSDEPVGNFRVVAAMPSNDTKVDIDGLSVKWNESDVIAIAEVGENGEFVESRNYYIDEATISENGKYAEFKGANLTKGKQYIAYNYQGDGEVKSSSDYDIVNLFCCTYDYTTDNLDLIMQSQIFEYNGESLPQLSFEYNSSVLELDVKLNNSLDIENIVISNTLHQDIFNTSVLFDSYGKYVYKSYNSNQYGVDDNIEIKITDNVELSSNRSFKIQVPITWNGYITEAVGNFVFTITTKDGKESAVEKPMKVLKDGVHYKAELVFEDFDASERAALIDLYNSTNGDNWTNNDNWCSDKPLEDWYGVSTDTKGYVISIQLYDNQIVGSIPESIGNLTRLKSLEISGVNITGSIPETIGNLTLLNHLCISGGSYSLSTSDGLGQMSGEIPDVFSNMTELTSLNISCAQFSGSIPKSIGTLKNLEKLNLSYNQLEGSVDVLSNLYNLTNLDLRKNKLSGSISDTFANFLNWNELVWNIIDQKYGYGFTSLPDIYLEPSNVITIEGKTINTKDYFNINKLTCVVLWRSWCGFSSYYMNTISELYNLYASKGFGLISLNDESDLNTIKSYVTNNSIPGHVCQLYTWGYNDGTNRIKYMPTSVSPTYVFVDSDGKVLFSESVYPFADPTMSREEATTAFVKSYLGEVTPPKEDESTDYSKDGEVVTLQKATVGNGIDMVIMGDGFIDKDMSSCGEYETRMKEAMEHFFSEEPYKTLRNRYNVYMVKAISENDGVSGSNNTVFSCEFGHGTAISGDDRTVFDYAVEVPTINSLDDLMVIVVLNSSKYAGTCYMYTNDAAIAYCPIVEFNDEQFRQIVTHEAGGHGFGKLLDEYAYEGTLTYSAKEVFKAQKSYGWGFNVDITSDPSEIQWSQLLSDSRYKGLVGIYEGALTFEHGAYRPTDVSIMRYNIGGYNAPSRQAIYRRIMDLSGENYNYEKFVTYDAINLTKSAQAYSASQMNQVDKSQFVPLAQPVVVEGYPQVSK